MGACPSAKWILCSESWRGIATSPLISRSRHAGVDLILWAAPSRISFPYFLVGDQCTPSPVTHYSRNQKSQHRILGTPVRHYLKGSPTAVIPEASFAPAAKVESILFILDEFGFRRGFEPSILALSAHDPTVHFDYRQLLGSFPAAPHQRFSGSFPELASGDWESAPACFLASVPTATAKHVRLRRFISTGRCHQSNVQATIPGDDAKTRKPGLPFAPATDLQDPAPSFRKRRGPDSPDTFLSTPTNSVGPTLGRVALAGFLGPDLRPHAIHLR